MRFPTPLRPASPRLYLGLETTCDETAAAVVRIDCDGTLTILADVVASQIAIHAPFRGVAPEAAARAHVDLLTPVIDEALTQARLAAGDLQGVAASRAPGLVGCLLIGVTGAKALSWRFGIPWVGVDHIHAHIHTAYLAGMPNSADGTDLAHVALVVSGGHTALYHVAGRLGEPRLLGSTIDDAAGEAFDKVAALLGLPYPGGPAIQQAAATGNPRAFDFPRSKVHDDDDDFSFSGLKTAVLYRLRGSQGKPGPAATVGVGRVLTAAEVADAAASFQAAACDVLVKKTLRACVREGVKHVSLGGGVACNARLREQFMAEAAGLGIAVHVPAVRFCTDNAVMVAALGALRLCAGEADLLTLDVDPTPLRRR